MLIEGEEDESGDDGHGGHGGSSFTLSGDATAKSGAQVKCRPPYIIVTQQ